MNDDIEILDVFENKPEKKIKKEVMKMENPKNSGKKKKRKMKKQGIQIIFCTFSALFILGCIIFYGSRFIKYYRIYNPKVEREEGASLLAKDISGNSEIVYEGSGLYISGGNYIYKGDVNNNYLKYNNMLWRIIKINVDNTIEVILDDYISILPWNKETTSFSKSSMHDYLNKHFLNNLDKDFLTKVNYCEDEVNTLENSACEKNNHDDYLRLLDINSFLNSVKDKKSYLVKTNEIFWLSDYGTDFIWHTNGVNVSHSDSNIFYEVRPVIKLKSSITYSKGDGTKDNPYLVGEDKLSIGSIVKLASDEWLVYDMSDNVKLMKKDVLSKTMEFDRISNDYNASLLKEYLNGEYLDSLSYKDKIINADYDIGAYQDNLDDIKNKKVNVKVGIPSILDMKFNSEVNGYFTSTSNEEIIYVYENPLKSSKITTMRKIRPCIAISKSDAEKLKNHNGIWEEA